MASTEVQITPNTVVTVEPTTKVGVGIQTYIGLIMTAIPTIIAVLSAIDGAKEQSIAGMAAAALVAIVTQKNRTDQAVAKINAAAFSEKETVVEAVAALDPEDVIEDNAKLAETGVPVGHDPSDLSDERTTEYPDLIEGPVPAVQASVNRTSGFKDVRVDVTRGPNTVSGSFGLSPEDGPNERGSVDSPEGN